ncbi:MAG TPA: hypothetical protein VFT34_08165 [Verrucomicrobiae bacterium]|nr:hypothetical protein [Verrucomicrobiae bacterium]
MRNTTFKLLLTFAVCLLISHDALARRGYVRTRQGRIVEGHMRFESNAVVVVDAARELWAEVALTNIAALGFDSAAEAVVEAKPDSVGSLPVPWESEDVGSVREPGGSEFRGGIFRVRGTGTNVLADGDSFHFVCKRVTGESEIVARVLHVQNTDPWAQAGLMFRESLAADARHVFLAVTASRGGVLASRERKGGDTTVQLDQPMVRGYWLKLKRDSEKVLALASPDGRRWRIVERLTWPMEEELYAGLAVVSAREGVRGESIFDQVEEGASLRNRAWVPQVELKSGSTQAGYIERMDDTAVWFDAAERRAPVSAHGVALVRFQPVPLRLATFLAAGRKGVLLGTGEFIEGECGGIANNRVTISSVPLGLRRYDVNNEVIALVLGKRAVLPRRNFEVTTTDGATWLALDVALDREGLVLREPYLGTRRIFMHEIAEVRRGS